MRALPILPLLLLATAFAACAPRSGDASEDPRPLLRLGYTPFDETVMDRSASMERLARHLESRLDVRIELVAVPSYGPAIEALKNRELDILPMGSQAYLIAARDANVEALVIRGDTDGTPLTYQSILVANPALGIRDLGTLRARSKTLHLQFTDPASTSGYLAPLAHLRELGLDPDEAFAQHSFSTGHVSSIFNVIFGRADIAPVSSLRLERLLETGKISEDQFIRVWESPQIPRGPVVVYSGLPDALKDALREAYSQLHTQEPEVWRDVLAYYTGEEFIYLPAHQDHYRQLRQLAPAEIDPRLDR